LGVVWPLLAMVSGGNQAGIGDLLRACLNTEIHAGGPKLTTAAS